MDFQSATRMIPTQDEKDALKGTGGPPSRFNPFVTNNDSRLVGAGGKGYLELMAQSLIPSQDGMEPAPYVSPTYGVITVFIDFPDGNDAQMSHILPPNWDFGTIRAKFFGKAKSGTGTVRMGLAAQSISAGEYDHEFIKGQTVTFDTVDYGETVSDWTDPITVGLVGSEDEEYVIRLGFKVYREEGDGEGVLADDFELTGVLVEYGKA